MCGCNQLTCINLTLYIKWPHSMKAYYYKIKSKCSYKNLKMWRGPAVINTSISKIPTPLPFLLTVEFDSQLVGGPSQWNTTSGGWTWEGGAAEENISAECRFSHWVTQRRKALATIDTLIWQGTMEWTTVAGRLDWWRFLAVLQELWVEVLL